MSTSSAAHALVKLVVPGMIERGWGRLILVTSIVADLAAPGASSYTAAKGGLSALARALAAELGATGVTSNALSPGFFATETNAPISPRRPASAMRSAARPSAGPSRTRSPGAALFLASPAASYVNGHTLTVDGGVSATVHAPDAQASNFDARRAEPGLSSRRSWSACSRCWPPTACIAC